MTTTKPKRVRTPKPKPSTTPSPAVTTADAMQIIREEDAAERERLDPTPVVEELVVTPEAAATAAALGKTAAYYLRRHARKPYTKEADLESLVTMARAAWRAALSSDSAQTR